MSRTSRQRFRPPWMGKFNDMRRQYAAGFISAAELDVWHAEIRRSGDRAFDYIACSEPHATAETPLRTDFADDLAYRVALNKWLRLGELAAQCRRCAFRAALEDGTSPAVAAFDFKHAA